MSENNNAKGFISTNHACKSSDNDFSNTIIRSTMFLPAKGTGEGDGWQSGKIGGGKVTLVVGWCQNI